MGGRGSASGKPTAKFENAKYKTSLSSAESSIKGKSIEHAYILDGDGNVVLKKSGDVKSVTFTAKETSNFTGKVLTHNHPSSSSFSGDDVSMLVTHNMKEIRAVGDGVVYSLKMKPGTESSYEGMTRADVNEVWKNFKSTYQNHYQSLVTSKKMTATEAWKEHSHKTMTDMAKAWDLEYKRELI